MKERITFAVNCECKKFLVNEAKKRGLTLSSLLNLIVDNYREEREDYDLLMNRRS